LWKFDILREIIAICITPFGFWACPQNYEKLLLALSCPSVRMEQIGSNWMDFHDILYMNIFRKSVEKIKVSRKPDKNTGYFTFRPMYIYDNILLSSSQNDNLSEGICREDLNMFCVE